MQDVQGHRGEVFDVPKIEFYLWESGIIAAYSKKVNLDRFFGFAVKNSLKVYRHV